MTDRDSSERTSLLDLYGTFFYIGLVTFGGGLAMLPIFTRTCVKKHNWCTDDDLTRFYAIGQCTPGIIAINTSTFIGYYQRGIIGSLVSTMGMLSPSVIIISLIATVLGHFEDNILVIHAMNGIRVGVCVLVINAIMKLSKKSIVDKTTWLAFVIAILLLFVLGLSPVIVVVFGIAFGLSVTLYRVKKEDENA